MEVKMIYEHEVEMKLRKLPSDLRREVLDYLEFLLSKYQNKKSTKKKFKFDWEGGLSDIKGNLKSVELQHKALEWR